MMSNTKKALLGVLILFAALVLYRLNRATEENNPSAPQETPSAILKASPPPLPRASPSAGSAFSQSMSAREKHSVSKPPSVQILRKEIAQDPHSTPPSLLSFAARLGARMKEALLERSAAVRLLPELRECALPGQLADSPAQARALCLVKARELERKWPELHDQVEDMVSQSDPRAHELAKRINGFSER